MPQGATGTWDRFVEALGALDVEADLAARAGGGRWDAVGTIEGVEVVIEVRANPTAGDVLALAERDSGAAHKILVADQLWEPVRATLRAKDISYFDGRGHLRLWHRPLRIDSPVPTAPTAAAGSTVLAPPRWRLDSPSALDVALAVLDGTAGRGVRATAESLERSPGTVSKRLAVLRAAFLVEDDSGPVVPALFEAVADVWRPVRVPLAGLPPVGAGPVNERLSANLSEPGGRGWVLADVRAAAAWGAPVVAPSSTPPDFYVPDAAIAARARALLGDAEFGRHACTIAIAPCPSVCVRRFDRTGSTDEPFPAPSAIVAALDLAVDPARGRETLDRWSQHLPPELPRVW